MEDIKFLPNLSQNLLKILNDEEYDDITIEVGNDPYVKIFRAHMVILNYRSTYLQRILSTNKKKNDDTLVHIKLPNILPENIIKILVAASELNLQELVVYLQSFLIKNKTHWMEQNFNLIYQTSFENINFLELQKYCTDLISKGPDKVLKSISFSSISEKLLISIIQNTNLQMSGIQVWKYVIKWGLAQNPELPIDPATFSKEDFNVLKNTLQQIIPFIKFNYLTPREFSGEVLPYKKVLPKELYKDLLKKILNLHPDSKLIDNLIDSKIIKFQHAELISKWIDKLDITDELTSSYEFKLIFRGSREEFSIDKFHETCDNQSCTVTVVKVKNSNEILGGYNPIEWKSKYSYGVTKDSFIFSFDSGDDINKHILSRVKNKKSAIFNHHTYGPSFGGTDLILRYDGCYCKKDSYERQIRRNDTTSSEPSYLELLCDCCDDIIHGMRWKCTTCPDYDLCQNCKPKSNFHNHPSNHVFKLTCEFAIEEYELFQIIKHK
ncbi:hypothetical protein RirG_210540 [Rhizophagus irregularis DAOM 197198w]|uniref:Serine-enriched protein n=1 Tax=Rhizophagus irregularis (strain DAOM 197198w) TaxID=1432141 RepID=A0A015IS55_RHIIW|nr:hypothetical protein RirG_210540 [Rhizophagus irregularis DAOM 197198w]